MKVAALSFSLAFAATMLQAKDLGSPTDDDLIKFVQQRTNAVRITKNPYQMEQFVMMRCIGPSPEEVRVTQKEKSLGISDPHIKKFVHVYVSPNGEAAMRTWHGVFPEGAIVLKEKFSDATGTNTELFTGMIKREPGYDPECGDWEFFTLPGNAATISERGKIQNCMECHEEYKSSDFVTKSYINR